MKQREVYKTPLRSSYDHQTALVRKDCQAESEAGQQPYNVCMGKADEQADHDFAIFYLILQKLCHNQDQLATLKILHKS